MLGLTNGKGKSLDYLMEGFFIFIRKEIEEDFSEKVLLDARPVSLRFFVNFFYLFCEAFELIIVLFIQLIF